MDRERPRASLVPRRVPPWRFLAPKAISRVRRLRLRLVACSACAWMRLARSFCNSRTACSKAGQFLTCASVSDKPAFSAAKRASANACLSSAVGELRGEASCQWFIRCASAAVLAEIASTAVPARTVFHIICILQVKKRPASSNIRPQPVPRLEPPRPLLAEAARGSFVKCSTHELAGSGQRNFAGM